MPDPSEFLSGDLSMGMMPSTRLTPDERREQDEKKKQEEDTNLLFHNPVTRGVAGALEGILEIPTILPGVEYDIEDNFGLGHSTSVPGSLLEGTIQFLTGFLPGAGLMARVGKAGKARKIAQVATARQKAAHAKAVKKAVDAGESLPKRMAKVKAHHILAQAAQMSGKGKRLATAQFSKSMAVGAMADFAVFTHDEARLSNLLQHWGMDNAIVNTLAANPDDGEAIGRFKNMVEGAGIGFAIEGVVRLVRNIFKTQHVLRDASLTGSERARRIEELVEERQKVAEDTLEAPRREDEEIVIGMTEEGAEWIGRPGDELPEGVRPLQEEPEAPRAEDPEAPRAEDPEAPRAEEKAPDDLAQKDTESRGAWRKRLQEESKKHPSTKGSRRDPADKLADAIREARAREAAQLERKAERTKAEEREVGETEAEQATRREEEETRRDEEGEPAIEPEEPQLLDSDHLEVEWRRDEEEINTIFGEGSSEIRPQQTEEGVKWLDKDGKPISERLRNKLIQLRKKQKKTARMHTAEMLLGQRPKSETFRYFAHHQDLARMSKAMLEEGKTSPDKINEIIGAIDEAIASGKDPTEKIEGVINTALLSEDANMHIMSVLAEHGKIDPAKFKDHHGNSLGLTDQGNGTFKDKHGRTWTDLQLEEISRRTWAHMMGMSEEAAGARLTAFQNSLNIKKMAALGRKAAKEIGEASLNAQSMIHFIDMQLKHARDVYLASKPGEAADALRKELGLPSAEHARVAFAQWVDESAELFNAYGLARAETGRALRRYHIKSVDLLSDNILSHIQDELGGAQHLDNIGERIMAALDQGNHAGIAALKSIDRKRRIWFMVNEYFVNAVLSGLRTMSTNTVGNAITSIYGPLEVMLAARVKHGMRTMAGQEIGDLKYELIGANQEFFGLWSQLGEAAKQAGKTWNPKGTGFWRGLAEESEYRLDPGTGTKDVPESQKNAWAAENWAQIRGQELDPARFGQNVVERLGKVIRVPSKLLMTTDEFFKQWNYRTTVKADLMVRAHHLVEEGKITEDGIDRWVDEELTNLTARGQALIKDNLVREADKMPEFQPTNPKYDNNMVGFEMLQKDKAAWIEKQLKGPLVDRGAIADRAIEISRERTFTNELDPEGGVMSQLGVGLTKWSGKHPWMRLITPFIRTPLNILIYASRRAPLLRPQDYAGAAEYLYKMKFKGQGLETARLQFARDLGSSNPRVQIDALGRFQTGMAFIIGASWAASNGMITGAGPSDKDLRKVLTDSGWQPYSIKMGDTYMSYQKLDPLATVMGLYADMFDVAKWSTEEDQSALETLFISAGTSIAHQLKSKSYLQGLINSAGLLSDPELNVPAVTGRYLGAFAVPSFVAGFREIADDNYVEMRGILDGISSRIPGWSSSNLDPMRNVIGEKVQRRQFEGAARLGADIYSMLMPTVINQTTSDPITQELALLEYAFSNPSRHRFGTDLTDYRNDAGQSAHDRWIELVGQVKVGKRTLRRQMERLINSRQYQKLPLEGVAGVDEDSPRIREIQRLLRKYRGHALKQMLKEFPELAEIARTKLVTRTALRQGLSPTLIRARLFPVE